MADGSPGQPKSSIPPQGKPSSPAQAGLLRVAEQFKIDRDAVKALDARTSEVDSIVLTAVAEYLLPEVSARCCVAAVGGYGRRELFPYSDIDLLFAFESEADLSAVKEPLSACLQILWDSGLRVSQSVRTVGECCRFNEQNVELHISLLDRRFLCGNQETFAELSGKLSEFYRKQNAKLSRRLSELARQRHAKYNDTVYHLEPNIKESPGGIRDLHFLGWLMQLNPQLTVVRESIEELRTPREFLFVLRCFLHFESGRDNNLLTFELQDRVAEKLPQTPISPERWMRSYYQSARQIFQPTLRAIEYVESQDASLFRELRSFRSRLSTAEFSVLNERVFLRNPANTLSSADSLFELFTFLARHGVRLSWDAQRRLRASTDEIQKAIAEHPPSRQTWRELLLQPHTAVALREMQEVGVLGIAIPEWNEIDSLVVRDFYHRYTVDEHTLVAIESIDNLVANKPGTPPKFHALAEEEDDLAVLRFAILLHDVGKGTTPGDHVRGSLDSADNITERLQVPSARRDAIRFLIEHHLDLSLIMNGRDLEDPATARFLTSRVGTQERLRQLTLLTYADINAVNPTAMTPWRLEQLWRVYSLGMEQLTRDLVMDRIQSGLSLESELLKSPDLSKFLEGLPTRYLRTHSRAEIDRHFELSKTARKDGVAVETTKDAGVYLMSVIATDQSGLFASLCGALASFGMNIVKAEAFSNASGLAVDVIRFVDPMRTLELNPGELERLEWTISCVVRGSIEVRDLLKRRRQSRPLSSGSRILPRVRFNNDASDSSTLIDFVGEDRPGLLFDLATIFSSHNCNIEVVMIDTEAHKALDVFYVTQEGAKLHEKLQDQLRGEMMQAAMQS